jgi:hypothetical protein
MRAMFITAVFAVHAAKLCEMLYIYGYRVIIRTVGSKLIDLK